MKKLFISVPMKGRTKENIKKSIEKMHKVAEIAFDQPLEVINSYIEENAPEQTNAPIWYLGKSIELLSQADYFIGVNSGCYNYSWHGCRIETIIAEEYGIKCLFIEPHIFMPDAIEVLGQNNKYCV